MTTKHTPGPWTQAAYSPTDVIADGETMIATAREGLNGIPREQATSNARLIAAAPELLAALQAEQEWRDRDAAGAIDPEWDYERMVGDKRRAAIAKATVGA